MTDIEIARIINRGGDRKRELTKVVLEYLDTLPLSKEVSEVIANTDLGILANIFAGVFTAQGVEEVCRIINSL